MRLKAVFVLHSFIWQIEQHHLPNHNYNKSKSIQKAQLPPKRQAYTKTLRFYDVFAGISLFLVQYDDISLL